MTASTHRPEQARRPAGSSAGGQFAPVGRTEADLDLVAPDQLLGGIPHPVAWMDAGEARPADMMSVVRAGQPHHEDGTSASLTREQVRQVLSRHLPGLYRDELAAHLDEIERAAARLDEVEATDPDGLDPASLDAATAYPISLDRIRAEHLVEADAVAAWRDELRDWWAAYTQSAIHTAWTHSLQSRRPIPAAVTR